MLPIEMLPIEYFNYQWRNHFVVVVVKEPFVI